MKAMILAAGKGERMRPLTLKTPKPLLEAGNKPLIVYHIERLVAAGLRDIVINHAWLGEQIEQTLGDGSGYGARIEYSREGEPLETAGGIINAMPMLTAGNNDWFAVINGDIWTDFDFSRLTPSTGDQACLALTENPPQHPDGDFHLDPHNRVHDEGNRRLTFTGISLLHRSLFDQCPGGHAKLAPLLRAAMARGQVSGLYHPGRWYDIGTPERLQQLDRELKGSRHE
ncbi:N-acetylmuramate alpha-1-phosphate uridylyltransferase MurU [Marinobacter sp. BGYM27]|uniref:N-acetylmuramate alpha-1-phosphate uridylyltransferase MurU n=1 Tax=Marinobacter sp. BGYM27 TaxID=2975597 RepID=UPI0021A7491E|nr:nucleotidyltransferase family protein [Marinobacter sp. BGYM27]